MVDFNKIKFKGKDDNFNELKGGIKRESIKDSTLLNIFDKIDSDSNKILDSKEINLFQQAVQREAEQGNDSKLSKKEAGKYLESIGLQADKTQLFKFLNTLSNESSNIKSSNVLEDGSIHTEYNNGITETISQDGKTKEIKKGTTTQKFVLKADGEYELAEEIFVDPKDGSETITKFKDGKKASSVKTYPDNTTETVNYDENGKEKSKEISKDGGKTIESYEYENGKAILKSKKENIGSTDEKITTYEQDNSGTTETITENGKQTTIKKDNNGKVTTTTNDGKNIITTVDDGNTQTKTVADASGKKLSETKIIDGKEYSVEYDGMGNTKGVTVENGESPAVIAKKFGCKVEDLINANKDSIQGKAPNQYFLVGADIVIPGEIDADKFAEMTSGRQSKEDAVKQYAVEQQVRDTEDKEVEDRKNNGRTFIEKKYNTFKELAIGLFKREGNDNPTARQIELRVKELKALNPDLKDGELIGNRVIATFNNSTDASIGAGQQSREEARNNIKIKKEMAAGKQLAQTMYSAMDDHIGGVGEDDFQAALKNVNSDNVIGLLKQYKQISPDESLIESVMDETGNYLDTRKGAIEKIVNSVIERANKAGISDARQRQAVNACKQELESYWSMGIGYCQTSKLDGLINNLVGAIDAAEALTNEEKVKNKNNGINETITLMNNQVETNTEKLDNQLKEDGWCADFYEGLKWCAGSDNLDEKVKADLEKYKSYIGELQKAEQEGGEEGFKTKFKEIFGVEYDKNLVKGYNKLQNNFAMAQGLSMQKEGFYQEFYSSMNGKEDYDSMRAKYGQYLTRISEGQINDGNNAVDVAIETELKKQNIDIKTATPEQKQAALKEVIKNTYNGISADLDKYTNGQSLESMKQQLDTAGSAVFGNKNDIAFRVNDYISSQQQGGAAVNMAVKATAAIAIAVATGGTGLAALATASALTAGASFVIDSTDRVSSDAGLKDGEIMNILKNSAVDGASVFAGGMVGKYAMMFKSANAFTQAGGRLIMQAAGDVATGAAAEYVQTGTITLEGVAFQAVFSAAGNLISLKQIAKTDIPEPKANVLDKATGNGEHTPGGKLGKDKFKQAKSEVASELPDADPVRAAQIYNEADQLQAQSRAQGREIKHIVEDNIGQVEKDLINMTAAQKADMILSGDNGPLSSHAAATLNDHITNNLKTVEELEAFKKRLQERVGVDGQGNMHSYGVQGKDHAAELIRKADAKIADIRAKQSDFNSVKQSLNDKIASGKGLDETSIKEITTYIQKCDNTAELDEISNLLKNKNIKASQSKRNLQQLIETKKNKIASKELEAKMNAEAEVEPETPEIDNVSPDVTLKNKFGATLYQAYEKIIDGINNLKTIVDFNRIKISVETKFASFKEEMQSMLEKLNKKAKSIGLEDKLHLITGVDSNPKLKLPEEIAFDNIKISNRVPAGERRPNASMSEVLLPEQRKVYTDSYNAYRASKDLKIQHNASDILTNDNLLHSTTKLESIIGEGGILENGLIPRELTGVEGASFSGGGSADTLTPLSTDVWDVQGSTSIRNYFSPEHPHWRNNGESNFMSPNFNDGRGKAPIIIVLNKKAMDSTLINNSFNVNTSGSNNIMFKNGLMGGLDENHNYPTHRAIPIGAPANSIDRIIIDPKYYGQENINKIIFKIKSQGLDIKLFDLNGNELSANINLSTQSLMSA